VRRRGKGYELRDATGPVANREESVEVGRFGWRPHCATKLQICYGAAPRYGQIWPGGTPAVQQVCTAGVQCMRRTIGTFLSLSAKTRILQTQISTNHIMRTLMIYLYLTGVHLMGGCLMGVYLTSVYLMGLSLRRGPHGRVSDRRVSLRRVLYKLASHRRASHRRVPHGHVPHES
jgi:hypothetical protein